MRIKFELITIKCSLQTYLRKITSADSLSQSIAWHLINCSTPRDLLNVLF